MFRVFNSLIVALLIVCGSASAADKKAKPNASPPVRVAIVNYGTLFTRYEKAADLKKSLVEMLAPLKNEAEEIKEKMAAGDKLLKNPATPQALKDTIADQFKEHQEALEGLERKAKKDIGKRQEMHIVALWLEIKAAVAEVAKQQDMDIVFAYGDPQAELDSLTNINRKMQGMDTGSVVPVYVRNGADITDDVLQHLNLAYRAAARSRPTEK